MTAVDVVEVLVQGMKSVTRNAVEPDVVFMVDMTATSMSLRSKFSARIRSLQPTNLSSESVAIIQCLLLRLEATVQCYSHRHECVSAALLVEVPTRQSTHSA